MAQVWGYKYLQPNSGPSLHADKGAVNVHLWVVPDECNLDPSSGGLTVYKFGADANVTWEGDRFPRKGDLDTVRAEAQQKVVVPYHRNRAVIFHGDFFHETEAHKFKPSFDCHRVSVVLLFGKRPLARV